MRYSQLFGQTRKTAPSDADTINHKLLVQAGFVRQLMAGVYTYLPLGLRVLNKISDVIREEMNSVGSSEVLMPSLHPDRIWKQTGGWDSIDVLFKLKSRTDRDYALAQSHEEVVTPLASEWIRSYKDLPLSLYQIQWHFRDELRSKSGILRGREFLMKDMYSWHDSVEEFERYYEDVKKAYLRVFQRLGMQAMVTEASGGAFTDKISYEFEVLSEAGEANILYCEDCQYCVNTDDLDKHKEGDDCPHCGTDLKAGKAAEVGNIFDLGQKYTKAFDLKFTDENNEEKYPLMGCYGIGVSRTMGVLVEKSHDEKGIIWPEGVAPYQAHLVGLNMDSEDTARRANEVYGLLEEAGVEILYDDRDTGAGEKLADADLIGVPFRLVVSNKTENKIEWKGRTEKQSELLEIEEVIRRLT